MKDFVDFAELSFKYYIDDYKLDLVETPTNNSNSTVSDDSTTTQE